MGKKIKKGKKRGTKEEKRVQKKGIRDKNEGKME